MTEVEPPSSGHPERSVAKSKDPAKLPWGFATGFLDSARNDGLNSPVANHHVNSRR